MTENNHVEKTYVPLTWWAFSFSILSPFGLGLFGWIGFFLGITAKSQFKADKHKGEGFIIASIILGAIFGILKSVVNLLIMAGVK